MLSLKKRSEINHYKTHFPRSDMAKTTKSNAPLRDCVECSYSIGEPHNHMIGCSNEIRNPGGYKVGYWPRVCEQYKSKRKG